MLALDDGGFLLTGATGSAGPGNENLLVMRTNAVGEVLWSNTFGGALNEVGVRARVHPAGGFAVLGYTDNSWGDLRGLYLLRLDDNGALLWSRTIGSVGNDDAGDMHVLPDGGYLLTGNSGTFGSRRMLVARLDASGDLLWAQQPGGAGFDAGFGLALAADGGFIAVGTTEGLGPGQRDLLVIRFNAAGDQQWVRTYGGSGSEQAFSVLPADGGGWVIGGSTTTFGSGGQNMLVLRIDDLGAVQWAKAYGGPRFDILRQMIPAHGGGHLLVGGLQGTAGQSRDHGLLMHIDDDGEPVWAHSYGESGLQSELLGAVRTPEGYVATGFRSEPASVFDLLLMRTDLEGQSGCDQEALDMPASDVTLVVTTPTPINSTLGIFTTEPPTETGVGLPPMQTYCLDFGTGLGSRPASTALRTYPNPAHDRLWIETDLPNPSLRLLDARGTLVLEGPLVNGVVDVRGLAPGLYTGQLVGADGARPFRFVKE